MLVCFFRCPCWGWFNYQVLQDLDAERQNPSDKVTLKLTYRQDARGYSKSRTTERVKVSVPRVRSVRSCDFVNILRASRQHPVMRH